MKLQVQQKPVLTKNLILSKVTEEEIFEMYFGIKVEFNTLVKSPPCLRSDTNPTCSFYYNKTGKLKFRDFNGSFWGDCFDAVGRINGYDSTTKFGFYLILLDIASKFTLFDYTETDLKEQIITVLNKPKTRTKIEVYSRTWNKYDRNYWYPKGNQITERILNYFNVIPADEVYIIRNGEKSKLYKYHYKDPCYAYYLGKESDGIQNWKLYFPFRKKEDGGLRFYTNVQTIEGHKQLAPTKFGLVTKSLKDVISLFTYGIASVASGSENTYLTNKQLFSFSHYADYWGTLMDYDRAGIRASLYYQKESNLTPIWFTDNPKLIGSGFKGAKDFSQFNELYGIQETKLLVEEFKKPYLNLEQQLNEQNPHLHWF